MSEYSSALVGSQFPLKLGEIFHRSPDGRIQPRTGFVEDLICRIQIMNVQNTTLNFDPTPIVEALRAQADDERLNTLLNGYQTLVLHYGDYCETNDPNYLKDLSLEAKKGEPGFAGALQRQLEVIDPSNWFQLEERTKPLDAICDAYIKLFTLHFFAKTTLHPQTKSTIYILQPQIRKAIEMLRRKLQDTLLPGGNIQNSALLEAFLLKDSNRFEQYAHYDGRYCSIQGVQRFVQLANCNSEHQSSILIEKPYAGSEHKEFADKLIQLIEKFETLSQVTSFIETVDEERMLPDLLADLSLPLR
ncbi:hypothetical protein [Pseudomonas kitaguniensis]|uniref:hypothetical protein n=1 Tax=Pseudomonas kitaguniensis TaxID=2607908 RepID=UPI003B9F7196